MSSFLFVLLFRILLIANGQTISISTMQFGCGPFQYMNSSIDPNNLPSIIKSSLSEIDEYLEYLYELTATPSVSYGIVYDSSLIYYKSFGFTDLQNKSSQPTMNSIYRIGSISKVFTVLMAYIMRDKGIINSFEDTIYKYNNAFNVNNMWGITNEEKIGHTLTIKQLASQISGLPREAPCDMFNCHLTTSQIFDRLKHLYLIHPTDIQSSYSNLAFAIIGNVLSEYYNQNQSDNNPYNTLLNELIIKPMNLQNTGQYLSSEQLKYSSIGYNDKYKEQPYVDIGWVSPAGQLFSSVEDLSKLIIQFFKSYPSRFQNEIDSNFNFITSPQTLREMLRPVYINPDHQTGFGTPWEMQMLSKHYLRGKSGNINGFSSNIEMIPEMKLSVIALSNFDIDESLFSLGSLEILIPAFTAYIKTIQSEFKPILPNNITKYVGSYYVEPDTFMFKIFIDKYTNNLMLSSGLQGMLSSSFSEYGLLTWMGLNVNAGNSFIYNDLYDDTETCWTRTLTGVDSTMIQFTSDSNGDIVGAKLPDNNYELVLVKRDNEDNKISKFNKWKQFHSKIVESRKTQKRQNSLKQKVKLSSRNK